MIENAEANATSNIEMGDVAPAHEIDEHLVTESPELSDIAAQRIENVEWPAPMAAKTIEKAMPKTTKKKSEDRKHIQKSQAKIAENEEANAASKIEMADLAPAHETDKNASTVAPEPSDVHT